MRRFTIQTVMANSRTMIVSTGISTLVLKLSWSLALSFSIYGLGIKAIIHAHKTIWLLFFGVTPKGKQALCPGERFYSSCADCDWILSSCAQSSQIPRVIWQFDCSIVQYWDNRHPQKTSKIQHPRSREAPSAKVQVESAGSVFDRSGSADPNCKIGWTQLRFGAWSFSGSWMLDLGCFEIQSSVFSRP